MTLGCLAAGLAAFVVWQAGGNDAWVVEFFRVPGALLLVALAAAGMLFSVLVCRRFFPGEPMRHAWQLIALAAGADFAGSVLIQVLGAASRLNPLTHFPERAGQVALLRSVGLVLAGPCRFALLAAALFLVLRLYRRSGFPGRYTATDRVALVALGVYLVRETVDVVVRSRHGKAFSFAEILNFPADPLLWLLLAEALRLYRSVRGMGGGWISKCYGAFSAGIFLIMLGDVLIWATAWGYLPYPWSAVQWYVWIPAAGAFAMAPAYQWEAMRRAESSVTARATGL